MWGRELDRLIANFIIGLVFISAVIGGAAVWGIPKFWAWIKPLIHGFTA